MSKRMLVAILIIVIGIVFSFCQISSAPAEDVTWTKEESGSLEVWKITIDDAKCSITIKGGGSGVIVHAKKDSFEYTADVSKNGTKEAAYMGSNGGGYNVFVRHCAKSANAQLPKKVKEKFFGCCSITTK